ncbi:hypothetical protein [Pedobacter terrae]|uniref:hypothetical protein n=1 Tax=Pedobacter terrae TaxID=405671 RepID=UPI002FF4CC9D
MKKNTLLLALSVILLVSCSKKTETSTDSTPKKIERILIAPEYLLPLKSTDIYIGIRYFKDYTAKDEVTLTLNNQSGTVVSEQVAILVGTNLLFKLPAINQPGEYKINCTVKNNQNFLAAEQTLRIVNDFNINSVWNSLDKTYSASFTAYANRFKTTGFTLVPIGTSSPTQVRFGSYFTNIAFLADYVDKSFIPGLLGAYTLKFNGNQLQEIEILNGEPINDQNFNVTDFYKGLTDVYGNSISQANTSSGKVTIFKSGVYTLTITETPALIKTSITKS